MSDNSNQGTPEAAAPAPKPPDFAPQDLQEFVRLLGQVLGAAGLYGINHKIVQQALTDSYARLAGFLQAHDSLSFAVVEGNLLLEGCSIDTRNPQAAGFVKRLQVQNVESFDLVKTVTREELGKLLEILATPPDKLKADGTFAEVLAKRGLGNVRANTVSFQKVSQTDLVMKKDDLINELANVAATVAGAPEKPKTIEQIVAFLKGDVGGDGTGGRGGGKDGGSPEADADKLADMILKAADIRQDTAQVEGGESLVDLVVGSLRRHAQQLLDSPAARTQQGRKNIAKTLMLLEKTVLDRLRTMAGEAEVNADPVIEAIEDMKNDLQVDALATDYMKKRAQVEGVEGKILKYLRRNAGRENAAAGLQDRLMAEGLTPAGWQQLQVRSGSETPPVPPPGGGGGAASAAGGGPAGGIGMESVQMLAMLLTQLDSMLDPTKAQGGAETLPDVVKKIDENVTQVTEQTEKQLTELAGVVGSMAAVAETADQQWQQALSRKRLLEILAEITQELCQPLSVINCTLDMMVSKRLGDINESQQEMLELSAKNGVRLQHLVEKIREICGNPESRTPDKAILDMVYSRQ